MAYPFLITLTASVTNDYDYARFSPYPKYWFSPEERYLKFLAEKYASVARFKFFASAYRAPWNSFNELSAEPELIKKYFPVYGAEKDSVRTHRLAAIAGDYKKFLQENYATRNQVENLIPLFLYYNLPVYQNFLEERYEKIYFERNPAANISGRELELAALGLLGQIRGDTYDAFSNIKFQSVEAPPYELRNWIARQSPFYVDFLDWIRQLPVEETMPVTRDYIWVEFLRKKAWTPDRYNQLCRKLPVGEARGIYHSDAISIYDIPYPPAGVPPELSDLAALRYEFETSAWPLRLTRLTDTGDLRPRFLAALKQEYPSLDAFNIAAEANFQNWDEIPFSELLPGAPEKTPVHEINASLIYALNRVWCEFAGQLPANQRQILAPETHYQQFLLKKYGALEHINQQYGWSHTEIESISLPIPEFDYFHYRNNQQTFFWKFLTFNFGQVIKFMITKGRALLNTILLVFLTMLATLTVNPLAAYALSRFNLKTTRQILVFLLATMAFPAEVAMIPSFLLLRDLNLLNTFAALILPGLANGYSIFLLKGFFDSLPKELYEAAAIDGASEITMFLRITLPLCKPILAVIALGAFLAAYGGFMWAFLVCQDQNMWTLMVWLYQFQQQMATQPSMIMAALVLSSIPTLIVFLTSQKIILRGIIIPTMK